MEEEVKPIEETVEATPEVVVESEVTATPEVVVEPETVTATE